MIFQAPPGEQLALKTFTNDGPRFRSSVQWLRNTDPKSVAFPGGFQFIAKLIGARYTPPKPGTNLLTGTAEAIAVNAHSIAPSWPGARKDSLTLKANNQFVSSNGGFSLKVDPRTGLFRGTVLDPRNKKRTFQGSVLQSGKSGGGHFVTKQEVGAVNLKAE